jgi:hypothetical protein
MVNTELCIGCGSCVGACPYSARYLDPRLGVVDKCTYCTRLLEKGQEPACVAVCPTRVRIFGDASDPSDPVHALVRDPGLKQIVAARTDTKPAMFFKGHTVPTDWPRDVAPPLPVRVWRSVMTPVTSSVGAMTLIGIGLVALRQLFDRKTRNAGGKEAGKEEYMIRRHSRRRHFHALVQCACWITLLLSGFALIDNAELQPVGMWYVDAWHAFLAPQDILVLHVTLGVVWAVVYAVYVLLRLKREAVPFLKEIFSFTSAAT